MQRNLDMENFMKTVQQQLLAHRPAPPQLSENHDRLAKLVEDGILFLPGYVAPDVIKELYDKIAWLPLALRDQTLDNVPACSKFAAHDWGLYRVYDVEEMYPEANLLIEDPVIQDLVRSYLSNQAVHKRTCIELRDRPGDPEAFTEHMMHHSDHYFPELKVWLLMIDVGMSQAPMRFYTKTHKFGAWRALPDYLRYLGVFGGDANGVHPHAVRYLREHSAEWVGVERVYCTGPAGTVIIADTRGLHRAWMLDPGEVRIDMYSDYRMDPVYEYF